MRPPADPAPLWALLKAVNDQHTHACHLWIGQDCSCAHRFVAAAREALERVEKGLTEINEIRNSIIGHQNMNWSEHIYPLVAALNGMGVFGLDFPEARERVARLHERVETAEARLIRLEEALTAWKVRLSFVGHPEEPRQANGDPDWSSVVKQTDAALEGRDE